MYLILRKPVRRYVIIIYGLFLLQNGSEKFYAHWPHTKFVERWVFQYCSISLPIQALRLKLKRNPLCIYSWYWRRPCVEDYWWRVDNPIGFTFRHFFLVLGWATTCFFLSGFWDADRLSWELLKLVETCVYSLLLFKPNRGCDYDSDTTRSDCIRTCHSPIETSKNMLWLRWD